MVRFTKITSPCIHISIKIKRNFILIRTIMIYVTAAALAMCVALVRCLPTPVDGCRCATCYSNVVCICACSLNDVLAHVVTRLLCVGDNY